MEVEHAREIESLWAGKVGRIGCHQLVGKLNISMLIEQALQLG
jgi:hypothetical protein